MSLGFNPERALSVQLFSGQGSPPDSPPALSSSLCTSPSPLPCLAEHTRVRTGFPDLHPAAYDPLRFQNVVRVLRLNHACSAACRPVGRRLSGKRSSQFGRTAASLAEVGHAADLRLHQRASRMTSTQITGPIYTLLVALCPIGTWRHKGGGEGSAGSNAAA